ncbi:hypothetical protein F511_25062 [Dorcoceras hygrometricum]|uniref:Uncharacterized protein n=1 Tax=Dorcoceras hygrometricum TaxID=472368 RepID=A0A2Z7C184_9LAMI|nr:hypothetical protein F511_25062 [Dorcoceras hygrometricum]
MSCKSYSAPELIKEDHLCHFGFSRKGVRLVGDLAERMGKATMLKALKEHREEAPRGRLCGGLPVPIRGDGASLQPDPGQGRSPSAEHPQHRGRGSLATQFAVEMLWDGEVINRLTRAHREVNSTRQSFDEVLEHHTELEMQLEELETIRAQEKRVAEAQKEALEAHGKKLTASLAAKKEALTIEKKIVEAELEALERRKLH